MQWLFGGIAVFGGMCSLAWFGERDTGRKRLWGRLAVGTWFLLLVLGNTLL